MQAVENSLYCIIQQEKFNYYSGGKQYQQVLNDLKKYTFSLVYFIIQGLYIPLYPYMNLKQIWSGLIINNTDKITHFLLYLYFGSFITSLLSNIPTETSIFM